MQDFLDDQKRNTKEQHDDIDAEAKKWLERLEKGMKNATDFKKILEMVKQTVAINTLSKRFSFLYIPFPLLSKNGMGIITIFFCLQLNKISMQSICRQYRR